MLLATVGAGVQKVDAQNWLDALKSVATEVVDQATGGKLTEVAIVGEWSYTGPGVKMGSSNTLSNLAGSAMESTVENKLKNAYEKVGIAAGFCSINFQSDNTFTMPIKGRTISGTYEFDSTTHAITLKVGKLGTSFKGYAYIDGENLQLVFSVEKLVSFVTTIGSKISSLSSISSMLEQYDEVNLGFEFGRSK